MIATKEYVIGETAKQTEIELSIVEKIFSFQFKDVVEATKTANSIEINGLCRLLVSKNKLENRIKLLENTIIKCNRELIAAKDKKKPGLQNKIKNAQEALEFLVKKLGNED